MSDTKFTPGPWKANDTNIHAGNEHIVTAWGLEGRVSDERNEGESWLQMRERTDPSRKEAEMEGIANAHLIAATPDMYKWIESEHCPNSNCDNNGAINHGDELEQCQWCYERNEILMRARGEQ